MKIGESRVGCCAFPICCRLQRSSCTSLRHGVREYINREAAPLTIGMDPLRPEEIRSRLLLPPPVKARPHCPRRRLGFTAKSGILGLVVD